MQSHYPHTQTFTIRPNLVEDRQKRVPGMMSQPLMLLHLHKFWGVTLDTHPEVASKKKKTTGYLVALSIEQGNSAVVILHNDDPEQMAPNWLIFWACPLNIIQRFLFWTHACNRLEESRQEHKMPAYMATPQGNCSG